MRSMVLRMVLCILFLQCLHHRTTSHLLCSRTKSPRSKNFHFRQLACSRPPRISTIMERRVVTPLSTTAPPSRTHNRKRHVHVPLVSEVVSNQHLVRPPMNRATLILVSVLLLVRPIRIRGGYNVYTDELAVTELLISFRQGF